MPQTVRETKTSPTSATIEVPPKTDHEASRRAIGELAPTVKQDIRASISKFNDMLDNNPSAPKLPPRWTWHLNPRVQMKQQIKYQQQINEQKFRKDFGDAVPSSLNRKKSNGSQQQQAMENAVQTNKAARADGRLAMNLKGLAAEAAVRNQKSQDAGDATPTGSESTPPGSSPKKDGSLNKSKKEEVTKSAITGTSSPASSRDKQPPQREASSESMKGMIPNGGDVSKKEPPPVEHIKANGTGSLSSRPPVPKSQIGEAQAREATTTGTGTSNSAAESKKPPDAVKAFKSLPDNKSTGKEASSQAEPAKAEATKIQPKSSDKEPSRKSKSPEDRTPAETKTPPALRQKAEAIFGGSIGRKGSTQSLGRSPLAVTQSTPALFGGSTSKPTPSFSHKGKLYTPEDGEKLQLQDEWSFTYSARQSRKGAEYGSNIAPIAKVQNIARWASVFTHIKRPGQLDNNQDLHVFKSPVAPMWEHPKNVGGGALTMTFQSRTSPAVLDHAWLGVVVNCIGDQWSQAINGIVFSRRARGDRLAIWLPAGSKHEVIKAEAIKAMQLRAEDGPSIEFSKF